MTDKPILIVGAGLSGSVLAERFSSINKKIILIEQRNHIGGNCYDYINEETNIRLCKYGAHIFHTNNDDVWNYVNKFSEWINYEHKVLSKIDDNFVPIPVNINTINILFNLNLKTNEEQNNWLNNNIRKYENITNSEEMANSLIGDKLYELLIHDYTYKQWNKYPCELSSDVLKRIPVNIGDFSGYFKDKYQALPKQGYTNLFNNLVKHENIDVILNIDYDTFMTSHKKEEFSMIIFTGPIDTYFKNLPKLEYRSIDFIHEIHYINQYQPNSVINYPQKNVPWTRIVEHKHFPNSNIEIKKECTLITKEITNDNGEPYYPILNDRNIYIYQIYKDLALKEEENNVYFLGRLATYKYYNMDQAIENSLNFFNKFNK